jgi:hypothetical protein
MSGPTPLGLQRRTSSARTEADLRESAVQTFAAMRHAPLESNLTTKNRLGTDSGASDNADDESGTESGASSANLSDTVAFGGGSRESLLKQQHQRLKKVDSSSSSAGHSGSSTNSSGAVTSTSGSGSGATGGGSLLLSRSTMVRRERPSLRQHALQMHHRITAQFEIQDRDRQRRFAKVRP